MKLDSAQHMRSMADHGVGAGVDDRARPAPQIAPRFVTEKLRRRVGVDRARALPSAVKGHDKYVHQLPRSEEHTSELQSQSNLVCRLLLEKKKTTNNDGSVVVL